MKLPKYITKRSIFLISLVFFGLCLFYVALAHPYVIYRLSTKLFAYYEIYLLKYPNSHLVETETAATSKVTMATYYTFQTDDDIDTVLEYMEHQKPGYVQWSGFYEEPTYRQFIYADETVFRHIFQALGSHNSYIEIRFYPSNSSETEISIEEHWLPKGVWLYLYEYKSIHH